MLGLALKDYFNGSQNGDLLVESDRAATEAYQMASFFASYTKWNPIEQQAIDKCQGHVLDIGAGAGRHALELQARGLEVTAVEPDGELAKLCISRGLKHIVHSTWQHCNALPTPPDTILLLMNGLGLAGYHDKLLYLARFCFSTLKPGGQVLADSSEILYLPPSPKLHRGNDEIYFRFTYDGQFSEWFSWLFASPAFVKATFTKAGFITTIIETPSEDRFLLHAVKP